MSVIHTNNITNKDGTSGPTISGITTVSSTGFMRVPVGDTRTRIVLPNENIVTDGLVLYLDAGKAESFGGDGTTWRDLSGENNNGTLVNGVGFTEDYGGSLIFDGVDDYVTSSNSIVLGNNPRTLEVWCKGTSTDRVPLALSTSPGSTPNVAFAFAAYTSSVFRVYGGTGTYDEQFPVSFNFIDGNWHQMLVTWDGNNPGTLLVYGDGSQVGSRIRGAGEAYNTTSGYIVGTWYDFNRHYNGQISSARVYNRALSAAEVLQNYNATKYRYEN
jgi:hypothetical protein